MAKSSKISRPLVACEITASQVFAARAGEKTAGIEILQTRTLADSITPNLMNPNIGDPDAVKGVLTDALSAAGGRAKDVSLVVPDAAVRVVLLDFDTLPDRKQEADAVVRFRLKKALPFDVERATVSYDAQPNGTTLKVIAAVMMSSVLEEYEGLIRGSGFLPGVVLPSTLASLGNVEGEAPSMVVKVVEGNTTIAILNQRRLLFYRTLDHGTKSVHPDVLAEDIYPSVVFFQDMYGVPVEKIFVSGVESHDVVAARLAQETSATVEELISPAFAGISTGNMPRSMLSGVLGALA